MQNDCTINGEDFNAKYTGDPIDGEDVIAKDDGDPLDGEDFKVRYTGTTVVKPFGPSLKAHTLTLSNLDLLSSRIPVTFVYVYRKPSVGSFSTVVAVLKTSLAHTLQHFYPFAGQIVPNSANGEPEILCDEHGVQILEADADISLEKFDYYNLDRSMQSKLVPITDAYPLHVQITHFTCGGFSISFNFDHAISDGNGFGKFLSAWAEIARGQLISSVPNHQRSDLLRARSPPVYDPKLDQTFIKCTLEEILRMPNNDITLKRLYHVDASDVDRLQDLASRDGERRTKIESVSAYVWKIMAHSAINESKHPRCKMAWLVDGRRRIESKKDFMSNLAGNAVSIAIGEAEITDLRLRSLSEVAGMAHRAITEVTNEDHFLDLIDWIERQRPGLVLAEMLLGRTGPGLVISSGRRFPVSELEFGFGQPVLGTIYSTIERFGVGYMKQMPSGGGDGSWSVFALMWPTLAAALESDPDHVFKPMTAAQLGLV